ncbi:MAG: hypothetical protein QE570_16820 [Verrucomicrobiota bacterium]|nr:hypothetical protein [Verrucomicrobiota bacterium]
MKAIFLALSATLTLSAQLTVPTTGCKFETRGINGDSSVTVKNGVSPKPAAPTKTKLTSYFLLGESRQWKSKDGRSLLGTIIAFEESVIEFDAVNPAAAREAVEKAPPAQLPTKPTLIRGDSVRLMVNKKPIEVSLTLLSEDDRQYVDNLKARIAQSTFLNQFPP